MTTPIRIKSTDQFRNVAYIYRRKGATMFSCALANGTPAAFTYAGIHEEMAASFAFEDCDTAEDALIVCERFGSKLCKYEIA